MFYVKLHKVQRTDASALPHGMCVNLKKSIAFGAGFGCKTRPNSAFTRSLFEYFPSYIRLLSKLNLSVTPNVRISVHYVLCAAYRIVSRPSQQLELL